MPIFLVRRIFASLDPKNQSALQKYNLVKIGVEMSKNFFILFATLIHCTLFILFSFWALQDLPLIKAIALAIPILISAIVVDSFVTIFISVIFDEITGGGKS